MISMNEARRFVLNISSVSKLKLIQIQDDLYSIPEDTLTPQQKYLLEKVIEELQRR
jgi:hypothetical protein